MLWGVNPGINQILSSLVPPHGPTLLRVKVKTEWYTAHLANPAPEEATGPQAASVTTATPGPLTRVDGGGGPMATDAQGQKAGLLGWPGVWAGSTCSPHPLGVFGAVFFIEGFSEVGLSLLAFLPAGWSQVLYSHLWLLDLKLLRGEIRETESGPLTLQVS